MKQPVTEEEWAALRREVLTEPPAFLKTGGKGVLLPYQQELHAAIDQSALVVSDKSRRVGFTWGLGAKAVLISGARRSAGGMDTLYLGYNLDMAREFIDTCAMWGRAFGQAASQVQEFLFREEGEKGADRAIQAFRISFASGFEIVALSSKPRSLRGRQGFVILDEFAFHDDAEELLKAAMALLIWGGKVAVISTHNGDSNPFNQLIQDIHAGRRPGIVVRITFDEALQQGLYQRICLVTGKEWSPDAEAKWRSEIRGFYGAGAAEELDCIPSQGSGTYLTRALIDARMRTEIPVIRWRAPAGFVDWSEDLRVAEIDAFCRMLLKPHLDKLDPSLRSCLGQDFGRKGDLSVIHPMQVRENMSLLTPFLLELRDVPYSSQRQILFFIVRNLPRFFHGALDATGNGGFLAESARQEFGVSVISEVMLSSSWYLLNMPKLKAAFEDATIELPRDIYVMDDYRAITMTRGVAKIPDDARTEGPDKEERHGDAAIAGALAVFASHQRGGLIGAGTTGESRGSAEAAKKYAGALGGTGDDGPRADLTDFMGM